jgi:hypothetical protein
VSYRVRCPVCGEEQLRHRCAHDASFVDDVGVDEVNAEVEWLLSALTSMDRSAARIPTDCGPFRKAAEPVRE